MGCRCDERRTAIVTGARAIAKGDAQQAVDQAKFVAVSTVQDAASAFRQSVASAKARLSRR